MRLIVTYKGPIETKEKLFEAGFELVVDYGKGSFSTNEKKAYKRSLENP